ncbi:MAG: sulfotransferase [Spirochaetia bacterium]
MRGRSTLSRLGLLISAFARHGRLISVTTWFLFATPLIALTRLALRLDELLYPELRRLPVEKPVFIMGHPRSGTTFFQRRVFRAGAAAMFTTWELFVPSVVLRRLLRPVVRLLTRNDVDIVQSSDYGHEVRLADVEEDEGLFLHRLDSEMMTFLCPRLLIDEGSADLGFRLGWVNEREVRRSMEFYRRCLRRNLFHSGKARVVAKCNPSVFRLPALLEAFPDAQIVYVVRRPEDSVRSFLAFTQRFVAPLLKDSELPVYFRRKYQWCVELYRRFEQLRPRIPPDQLLVLRFDEITKTPEAALRRFFEFSAIDPEEETIQRISAARNSRPAKRHVNDALAAFGITEEEVRRDLAFVRERYFPEDIDAESEPTGELGGVGS